MPRVLPGMLPAAWTKPPRNGAPRWAVRNARNMGKGGGELDVLVLKRLTISLSSLFSPRLLTDVAYPTPGTTNVIDWGKPGGSERFEIQL